MVDRFPGKSHVLRDIAPISGPYAGIEYPLIYDGLSTGFDGSIIYVSSGQLVKKVLLEYKTAKSSVGRHIDGNAHERLSFQVMQYLEAATLYPSTSFRVLANGAFIRNKNKYHVNFKIQAERLRCFSWFDMQFACTAAEFLELGNECCAWLMGQETQP